MLLDNEAQHMGHLAHLRLSYNGFSTLEAAKGFSRSGQGDDNLVQFVAQKIRNRGVAFHSLSANFSRLGSSNKPPAELCPKGIVQPSVMEE